MRPLPALLVVLLLSSSAHAFELRQDLLGNPMRWRQAVEFVVDAELGEALGEPGAVRAVEAAVRTYSEALPDLGISVRRGPRIPGGSWFGKQDGHENANSIIADPDWSFGERTVAVTVYLYNVATQQYVDTDIILNNGRYRFTDGVADSAFDLQNVLTHELGHALGLQHTVEHPSAVMYPSVAEGETSKRRLSRDDLEGLSALYGAVAVEAAGCAAAPAGSALPWALIALVFAAARRSRLSVWLRRQGGRLAVVGLTGLLVAPRLAGASELVPEPLPEPASLGVVATVNVLSSRTLPPLPEDRLLRTEVTVAVRECVSGSCPSEMTLVFPGGRYGDYVQFVDALRIPEAGETLGVALDRRASSRRPSPKLTRTFRLDDARGFLRFAALTTEVRRSRAASKSTEPSSR